MKTKLSVLVLVMLFAFGCSSSVKPVLDSPEHTFESLVAAIRAKDLDAYTKCWAPEKANGDGLVALLKEEPKTWERLQPLFKGPQKLIDRTDASENGLTIYSYEVEAPEMERPGLEEISFVQMGNEWKVYHW